MREEALVIDAVCQSSDHEVGVWVTEEAQEPPASETQTHRLQEINIDIGLNLITTPPIAIASLCASKAESGGRSFAGLQQIDPDAGLGLNHSSLPDLWNNLEALGPAAYQNIATLQHKWTHHSAKYGYPDYFEQCSLIAMLEQDIARRVCMCGLKSKKGVITNPSGRCNKPRLCWKCANTQANKTIRTFGPNFYNHQWGLLTLSYQGHLPHGYLSDTVWCLHWDAARTALKRLVETEMVGGAMWREELAILTLAPTTAQPHVHAIVPADTLSSAAIGCLESWGTGYRDDLGQGVSLAPSIDFRPIPTQADFRRVVEYLHKPINLIAPYQARWSQQSPLADKIAVNREMRDVMEAVINNSWCRHQVGYFGNMRAASKSSFIGVPPNIRQSS